MGQLLGTRGVLHINLTDICTYISDQSQDISSVGTEMPFKSDEKSGKVGRTFPVFFNFEGKRAKLFIKKGYFCI